MFGARRYILLASALVALLAAIAIAASVMTSSPAASSTSTTPSPTLKPPDSDSPAAGICADAEGPVAVVQVNPDVPSPRCQRVTREQRLKVVNNTDRPVRVQLAQVDTTIAPGAEQTIDQPFGTYLAPGVHKLKLSAYGDGDAELIVLE